MVWKVAYQVDLASSFNRAFSDKPSVVKATLRPMLNSRSVKLTIGQEIIDKIVKRTQEKSIDKNNKKFPKYSSSYMNSLRFKIYSKSDKVNLTLTKEMLSSMVVRPKAGTELEITMANDKNNAKAHGNIYGTYGRSKSTGKRRDFLGLPKSELDKIVRTVVIDASKDSLVIDANLLSQILSTQAVATTTQLDSTNILLDFNFEGEL